MNYRIQSTSLVIVVGHYSDIRSILGGRVGECREVQSITDDDGHYSDITTGRGNVPERSSVYEHYIDIDRVNTASDDYDQPTTDADGGETAVRSEGYEAPDPSVLATLRHSQERHDYERIAAGQDAVTTQQTSEEIEMTDIDHGVTVGLKG